MHNYKTFLFKDIHWFRYSQKKAGQFLSKQIYFFHKTYSCLLIEDLYQYVERTFPDHAVDLVYEAGCCGFSAARYFLNLGWAVVNPSDVREIKSAIKKQMP
jgi:hypothetical protein